MLKLLNNSTQCKSVFKIHSLEAKMCDQNIAFLSALFQKKFCYRKYTNNKVKNLEINSSEKWSCKALYDIKERLNTVKDKLSGLEITDWHKHTQNMFKASKLIQDIKQIFQPQLCTQAWCKFREILCEFPILVTFDHDELNTFHLCEAPGAFITALHFYLSNTGLT